ncbi:3-keto-disaccharide hydrolase [Maribacter cobaltidurans]|uniref:3-keto-alpha-glucoside-1,2-lyase/3-keto-2-hydroxy-glucal hydratase domain-containing protein n=1 Tax=Maribacter cobaltidurans TaxID=1178778 RepID=A0A223VAV6_9FLAO|nr:DUF1080 domain-containing protein [Maribacter cobaltidurans]ASV32456.1 hypothetical protein CJ263_20695 [Maribacter cobaltidurans]GGD75364.1 hypothetical protein GCM10011412_11380 [Maribacter cobaltidurans]
MRSKWCTVITIIFFVSCSSVQKKEGVWVSIFNGKDLEGWSPKFTGEKYGVNYLNTFRVKDGKLVVSYDGYDTFDNKFGHIFYKEKLSQFKLRLEYRFIGEKVTGAPSWAFKNSGIKYHSLHPSKLPLGQVLLVAPEAQILGGDGKMERFTGNVCTAGTHIEMNNRLVTEHCTNSNYPAINDTAWVKMELEVHGSKLITHKINGKKVLEYSAAQYDDSDEFAKELIKNGYPKILSEGYVALQAEGHPIEFKNIELMKLDD